MAVTAVLRVLGWACIMFAFCMLVPAGIAIIFGEEDTPAIFLISSLLVLTVGGALTLARIGNHNMSPGRREAFLLAVLLWTLMPVFAAIPFEASVGPLDAYFEAMSGLTTTGYSVFATPEDLPRSILFWRAELQWIGGLATIMLAVVLLGLFGLGGLAVYRSAIPSGDSSALISRLKDTLSAVWWVYLILTMVCAVMLWLTGVKPFHAVCYAMSTISTGGFVTSTNGIAEMPSAARWVLVVFMLGSALNFTLHWAAFHGRFAVYRHDPEIRAFGRMCGISALLAVLIVWSATDLGLGEGMERAIFAVASVASTTGYLGLPTEGGIIVGMWPTGISVLLLTLMMIGGAAGSTAGGFKLMRFALLIRQGGAELTRLAFPNAITTVTYGGYRVEPSVLRSAWNFLMLFMLSVAILAVVIDLAGYDLQTALALATGALSNAGAAAYYVTVESIAIADLAPAPKIGIIIGMLAGRLELLALLGLFSPSFWGR
ncbi:MAG: TrkH family potassium uptake protein [Minwuia sp.]|uniref:TrkH family potassium uptake protein n=1 Tax=Minwuia sp. TaxID=2493630 RepID=UPI003A8688EB